MKKNKNIEKVQINGTNSASLLLQQMVKLRLSKAWNMLKIQYILTKHLQKPTEKSEDTSLMGRKEGRIYYNLANIFASFDKKRKLAFLKLKLNKLKRSEIPSSEIMNYYEINFNLEAQKISKTLSKKSSFYSLKDQSTLLISYPNKVQVFNKRNILLNIILKKSYLKKKLSFEILKSLINSKIRTFSHNISLSLHDQNVLKSYGAGSMWVDPSEKLEVSSTFSAIPKKNQFSTYISFNSLNNSLIGENKEAKIATSNFQYFGNNKANALLKGLEILKNIHFKKKSVNFE